jgi:hemerythrin-like domain-containing protein
MKCTDILIQEHKVILRALEVLDHMAARTEANQPVAPQDVETLLHFLRVFADDYHQTKEECALFPELMRTTLANDRRLRHMVFEHDQERSLVDGLHDALRTKKGREFVYFANRLAVLMRAHIQKEDNVLFEFAERSLSQDEDDRITAELNKFHVPADVVAALDRLEGMCHLQRQSSPADGWKSASR